MTKTRNRFKRNSTRNTRTHQFHHVVWQRIVRTRLLVRPTASFLYLPSAEWKWSGRLSGPDCSLERVFHVQIEPAIDFWRIEITWRRTCSPWPLTVKHRTTFNERHCLIPPWWQMYIFMAAVKNTCMFTLSFWLWINICWIGKQRWRGLREKPLYFCY